MRERAEQQSYVSQPYEFVRGEKKKEKKIALANICIHHRIYLWETYIHNMVLGI